MVSHEQTEAQQRPEFGTVGLYEALASELNADPKWREMATPLNYLMVYEYEPPLGKFFLIRFEEGEITEVAEVNSPDERGTADFVITAKPDVWAQMIRKELDPNTAMATGKVKIKGKKAILLRHMKRFNYLIDRLCNMNPVFPDI